MRVHTSANMTRGLSGPIVPSSDIISIDISTCSIHPPGLRWLRYVSNADLDSQSTTEESLTYMLACITRSNRQYFQISCEYE